MVSSPAKNKSHFSKRSKSVTYQIDQPATFDNRAAGKNLPIRSVEKPSSWATALTAVLWLCAGVALALVYAQILDRAQVLEALKARIANTTTPAAGCPEGWLTYTGANSCYLFSHTLPISENRVKTWDAAAAYCQNKKSHLVCTNDLKEHDFVSKKAEAAGGYWTGFSDRDVEGNFLCKDAAGHPEAGLLPRPWQGHPSYQPDELSAPGEDCVAISGPFQWSWQPCTQPVSSIICEVPCSNSSDEAHRPKHSSGCPDGTWRRLHPLRDSCYKQINSKQGFDVKSAQRKCEDLHSEAKLLAVDSLLENEMIAFEFGFGKTWVNLEKPLSGVLLAELRKEKKFTNFVLPDGDLIEGISGYSSDKTVNDDLCAVMVQSNWNDVMCSMQLYFICEREI